MNKQTLIENPENLRPHVVLLGAGAKRGHKRKRKRGQVAAYRIKNLHKVILDYFYAVSSDLTPFEKIVTSV